MSDDNQPSRSARTAAGALLSSLVASAILGAAGAAAQDGTPAADACPVSWEEQFDGAFTPGTLTDEPARASAIICNDH